MATQPQPPEWTDVQFDTTTVDRAGVVVAHHSHSARSLALALGARTSLEMVAIPGGSFDMGSPRNVGFDDERPVHRVELRPFGLGRHEVTQEQWLAVMGEPHPCLFHGPKRPVDRLSWRQAQAFCERLSLCTGHAYRLPSEAEWEYACRAGTTTPFHFGETLTTDLANYVGLHLYLSEPEGVYRHVTTDVGTFPPNAFGLYDMLGNLWEWCADPWHPTYDGAPTDGSVWQGGDEHQRVTRGGCWHDPPNLCRCGCRLKFPQQEGEDFVGFRVAVSLDESGAPQRAVGTPERAAGTPRRSVWRHLLGTIPG